MSTTIVFPDAKMPVPTNGGFACQEDFRKYVLENQNGNWNSALHARPLAEKLADYEGDTIAQAFPLLFPYGHSGLPDDKAVEEMSKKLSRNKKHMSRNRLAILRKFLQHGNRNFHIPLFNLIVENLIMKESIFQSTRMYCNIQANQESKMGEKFGAMTARQLNKAIEDVQGNRSVQHSSAAEHQFLKSIRASCANLPHSNEASMEARRIYFSFLAAFGLPAVFLTVTPDDLRNFRIVVYALTGKEYDYGNIDVNKLDDETILADFKVREQTRINYPGLCAEEYARIVDLVIKHVFNWSEEERKSKDIGLFGEISAFCLATEEQGRKSLHGHFLAWVKGWGDLLPALQRRQRYNKDFSFNCTTKNAKEFYENACSAELFSDFAPAIGHLSEQPVFFHEKCRSERRPKEMRFTAKSVSDQVLREMRHQKHWRKYNGVIANCGKCDKPFSIQDIVSTALTTHIGKGEINYSYPDYKKRLDRQVYEMQKDFSSVADDTETNAVRYFASNALVNIHYVCHANRCFKKGVECYTNLPDQECEKTEMVFCEEPDIWSNWLGVKEPRYMFRFYPKRNIEDAYMNTHNVHLTKLLACNNNVLLGMNGAAVFYVTGYQAKATQKEERMAFQTVSEILITALEKRENNDNADVIPEQQQGFRNLLAGIYIHTNAHITAAPMAHHMAIHGSRFKYSHDISWLPFHGLERMFDKETLIMKFKKHGHRQVAYHRAMHYLYRPKEMEHMSSYQFEKELKVISLEEAEKQHLEWFDFLEEHPLQGILVIVYRDTPAVPVFPWNYLISTSDFTSSLMHNIDQSDKDFTVKEKYAKRFLILFCPLRLEDGLQKEGSYVKAFQHAIAQNLICEEMIEVADNVQTIHNSLNSAMPENALSATTDLIEADDIEEVEEEDVGAILEAMLLNIGSVLASYDTGPTLEKESQSFKPTYSKPIAENSNFNGETSFPVMENVIELSQSEREEGDLQDTNQENYRFQVPNSRLNSLVMQQYLSTNPENNHYRNDHHMDSDDHNERITVDATGSWESIVAWGKNAKLDLDQQVAFEILAATYVLTFHDDKTIDEKDSDELKEQYRILSKFARRDIDNPEPLCVFITGLAGSGKCKYHSETASVK